MNQCKHSVIKKQTLKCEIITMEDQLNKETSKLLQISDDSKSLSDLELPEITTQRKRKVRRKTRPKPSARRSQDVSNSNQCNRLIVWIAIFLTCCWLLTLSYMIAVIHSENLRLEVQIRKLSVTSQNLPEALQKWHETSKALEQNQTMIYGKISEIQHNLKTLTEDFAKYKEELKEKKDYSNDGKFVANFGAKIEAVSLDVEGMKEKFSEFQRNQNSIKTDVLRLKDNFTEVINQAAMLVNNKTTNYSKDINDLQELTFKEIKSVALNLSTINDTLSQKQKILELELTTNKRRLDDLIEGSANTTSHVVSVQNDWTKYKDKISHLEEHNAKLDEEIIAIRNLTAYLNNTVLDIQSKPDRIVIKRINPSKNDGKDVNKPFENNEQIFQDQKGENISFLNKSSLNTLQQDIKQNNTSTEPPGIEKPTFLNI